MQFSDAGDDCEAESIAASLAVAAAVDASEGREHLPARPPRRSVVWVTIKDEQITTLCCFII